MCSFHLRISLAESCLASRYPEDIWTGDWTAILHSACGKLCGLILFAWFNAFGLGQLSEDMISIDLLGMNGFEAKIQKIQKIQTREG